MAFAAGARMQLPASKPSRAAERVLSTGFFGRAVYGLDVLNGLILSGSFGYDHWFARSNVPTTDRLGGGPYTTNTLVGGDIQRIAALPGQSTVRDSVSVGGSAFLLPGGPLGISASFSGTWNFGHDLKPHEVDTLSGPVTVEDNSDTHMRGLTTFGLGAVYFPTGYLFVSLSYDTPAPHLDSDASRENPIWNERSQVTVSLSLLTDRLYRKFTASEDEDDN
jgi:hypothetical protein